VQTAPGWPAVTVSQKPAAIDWMKHLESDSRQLTEIGRPRFLHTNGCSFLLMDRERWLDLRGLPEADYPTEYLYTLFCYTAHFGGVIEEILREPMRISCPSRSNPTPAQVDEDLVWLITQMRRLRTPAIVNANAWDVVTADR
jgi:hypothetical protein